MKVESRLQKLEAQAVSANPPLLHILIQFVDPDPAIGVVSVGAFERGSHKLREFKRMPGESLEDLGRRAHKAMGWD